MASAEIAASTEAVPVLNLATDAFAAYRIWVVFADVVNSSRNLPEYPCATSF